MLFYTTLFTWNCDPTILAGNKKTCCIHSCIEIIWKILGFTWNLFKSSSSVRKQVEKISEKLSIKLIP